MIYVFGPCRLDTELYTLYRANQTLPLRPKVFDVLTYLMTHRDRVVSKNELCDAVWPEQSISNSALESTIRLVRQALGDDGRTQKIIQTFYGHGYRFIAKIDDISYAASEWQTTEGNTSSTTATTVSTTRQPFMPKLPPLALPFCGRSKEMATLSHQLDDVENGLGKVVGIAGKPGIGKSRLLEAFRQSLQGRQTICVTAAGHASERKPPLFLVRTILRQYFDLKIDDGLERIGARVLHCLEDAGLNVDIGTPLFLYMLGVRQGAERIARLRPELLEAKTIAAFCELLSNSRDHRTIVVLVDDLHAIDTASATYIGALVQYTSTIPLLLIATYETGLQPVYMQTPHVQVLSLAPLDSDASQQMVQSLETALGFVATNCEELYVKAKGNPLFLKTATLAQIDGGILHGGIPARLRDMLAVRLEHYPAHLQRCLRSAAVLAPHFSLPLLELITDEVAETENNVSILSKAGWFSVNEETGEPLWSFAHHSMQAVVYASLTPEEQKQLHNAAAQSMERLGLGTNESLVTQLLHHYIRAEEFEKASTYFERVAAVQIRYFAYEEATTTLHEALASLTQFPLTPARERLHFDLLFRLADVLRRQYRFDEIVDLLQPHVSRVEMLSDGQLIIPWALLLSQAYQQLGKWLQAAEYAQRVLTASASLGSKAFVGQAYTLLAMERYWSSDPHASIKYCRQSINEQPLIVERSHLDMTYFVLALSELLVGNFAPAAEAATHMKSIAEAEQDMPMQAAAAWTTGWIDATRGHTEQAIVICQQLIEQAPDAPNLAMATGILGYAYLEHKAFAKAFGYFDEALQQIRHIYHPRLHSLFITLSGEAMLAQGQLPEAQKRVTEGLALAQETDFRVGVAWAQRTMGKIALAQASLDAAERLLHQALAHFMAIPARFEVGQTHLTLADLAYRWGRREGVHRHLQAASDILGGLGIPAYMERIQQKTQDLALPL